MLLLLGQYNRLEAWLAHLVTEEEKETFYLMNVSCL